MVVLVWAGLRAIAGCWAQACIVLLASLGTEVVAPTLVSGLLGSCSHPGRSLFLCVLNRWVGIVEWAETTRKAPGQGLAAPLPV